MANESYRIGVETPSNNVNARSMSYSPAIFFGNVANVLLMQVKLAPWVATSPDVATQGYVKGLCISQLTSGANSGQYVNWADSGANGQGTMVGVLVDDRIPYYQYGSDTLPFRTPNAEDRFTIACSASAGAGLQLAALSAAGSAGAADVLAALATFGNNSTRIYNGTVVVLP